MPKTQLRKNFQLKRSKITSQHRDEAAQSAARLFGHLDVFKKSKNIACYLAAKDEFNSTPLIEEIWKAKKHCYLPVLSTENNKELIFVRYEYGDALHSNRYSILEPINISRRISEQSLDVVIVPLVAFDLNGHRLGTGGGYYDRTFAFKHAESPAHPFLLGLAYEEQLAETLPADPWDIMLDGVVTDKKFMPFAAGRK